ncbi:MAG TPA: type II 3-dehydroquinate dehydratase [Gemmatimonas aurantiaca]|uniref:3-dehydroquinate dehydratase n=2 Tax=Gemmatimonas aurantiaca TaxID=173480 RepID=AROQ_GEMAT|nr:type II 3-dehydroquinate dehydratase [Gemmatimonas aurantiaca]C1A4E4.1 RecName: Full=3-dehydroquinate dehydratase; Short=3-dehydroquinase; AltName: Full=Type II DHQase [Gemmatimonas aurantiaca T-27]BAH38969.1 3-dehydroquinate dehydratase [Gemmatimonas aurantiaca T-27]HCT57145.1 type II 3-dehydroquinate dehydratase [Gemmatimonas aurantiaca]
MIIGVLNGPNLNLLGTREPAVYGTATLADIMAHLEGVAGALGVQLRTAQSNSEGALIDILHDWRGVVDGVVVNAGAYTHTSLALRDAFTATAIPFIEVHLSNIHAREPERRHSMLASASIGMICGLGADGYEFGLRGLVRALELKRQSTATG